MKSVGKSRNFEDYRTSNPQLRYGEAFCNYYAITDTILFHEEDDNAAIARCALHIATLSLDA